VPSTGAPTTKKKSPLSRSYSSTTAVACLMAVRPSHVTVAGTGWIMAGSSAML
jgi:hypothetical protein